MPSIALTNAFTHAQEQTGVVPRLHDSQKTKQPTGVSAESQAILWLLSHDNHNGPLRERGEKMLGGACVIKKLIVYGTGSAAAAPDIGRIELVAGATRSDARHAQEAVTCITQKLMSNLQSLGVPDKDIHTARYSIRPSYEMRKDSWVRIGFEARNVIDVKARDLGLVSSILDAATQAGITTISSVEFQREQAAELEEEALRRAAQRALKKARAIAAGLGAKCGEAVRVEESGSGRLSDSILMESRPEHRSGLVAPPDEVKAEVSVKIVFELLEDV